MSEQFASEMSKLLMNLFSANKTRKSSEKLDEQVKNKENKHNTECAEDLPPVVIPRRLSLSKSGRMKEKKRSKLSLLDISRNEAVVDGSTQKPEPNARSASRENLDKAN